MKNAAKRESVMVCSFANHLVFERTLCLEAYLKVYLFGYRSCAHLNVFDVWWCCRMCVCMLVPVAG